MLGPGALVFIEIGIISALNYGILDSYSQSRVGARFNNSTFIIKLEINLSRLIVRYKLNNTLIAQLVNDAFLSNLGSGVQVLLKC